MGKGVCYRNQDWYTKTVKPQRLCYKIVSQASWLWLLTVKGSGGEHLLSNKKRQISWHQQFQAFYQEVSLLKLIPVRCTFPVSAEILAVGLIWSPGHEHDSSDVISPMLPFLHAEERRLLGRPEGCSWPDSKNSTQQRERLDARLSADPAGLNLVMFQVF